MLQFAKLIIAISNDTSQGLQRIYNIPKHKIRVIYLAASEIFKPSKPEEIEKVCRKYNIYDQYFIHVGHLDRKKNLPVLIKAFDYTRREVGFAGKLVLVGEKYPKGHDKNLFSTIDTLNLWDQIIFTGGVPDEDLPMLLSGALAKIFPTYHEGFGLAPLEAMACATPVIASAVGSIEEIIGDAGILLKNTNPRTVADAMIQIIKDPKLRCELSIKGYQRSKIFSWDKSAEETLSVYNEIIKL